MGNSKGDNHQTQNTENKIENHISDNCGIRVFLKTAIKKKLNTQLIITIKKYK